MELVKKILVSVLIVCGVALAGIIICGGILIVSPSTKIFGYSYLNTNSLKDTTYALENFNSSSINITVDTKDFNINIVEGTYNQIILTNHVFGFTKSADSEKYASVVGADAIDYNSGNINLSVKEPDGLYFTRDTKITIVLTKENLNKQINITTTTRKGTTSLGSSDATLSVNDLSCACTNARGGVNLENVKINGNLKIKNILGRINVKNDVGGEVTIDSAVGTYIFNKVSKLTVLQGSTEISSPSITVEECGTLNYNASSGNLRINKYLLNGSTINTDKASVYIGTCVKQLKFVGKNASITVNQMGNFEKDSLSKYNSWDYLEQDEQEYMGQFEITSGSIHVKKSYFPLMVKSGKGKITVDEAMKKVTAISTNGSIYVKFHNGDKLSTNTGDGKVDELNSYINDTFISWLDTNLGDNYSLDITSNEGVITVDNIRNKVLIKAQSSPVNANFIAVNGASNIESSSKAINVTAPVSNFKLDVKMNKSSGAKISIHFGEISIDSFKEDLSTPGNIERVVKTEGDDYKGFKVKVAEATDSISDVIYIYNKTGAIIASGK